MTVKLFDPTKTIVVAYVANNRLPFSGLPEFIEAIATTLTRLATPVAAKSEESAPAVHPKRSVRNDHIVCLEDGRKFKSLKRHLRAHHNLTPDEYRQKWNLPSEYPMVARDHSAKRSELAKKIGLGHKRVKAAPATLKASDAVKAPKKRAKTTSRPAAKSPAARRNKPKAASG